MKKQLLAGAAAFALAVGMTTGAMASDDGSGSHAGTGGIHGGFHSGRFDGVRGFSGWRRGDWGSRSYYDSYGADLGAHSGHVECPAYSRCGAGLPGGQ
jgi:hypothetical protein